MTEDLGAKLSKCTGQSVPTLPVCDKRENCQRYLLPELPKQSWIVMPNYLLGSCEYYSEGDSERAEK
jgi:hypothetical protein